MNTHVNDSTVLQQPARRHWMIGLGAVALATTALAGCYGRNESLFTRLEGARQAAAQLRLQFNKAADASNLAVMSDVPESAAGFVADANQARQAVKQLEQTLRSHLEALGYSEESGALDDFHRSFEEYEKLDEQTLRLAGEHTNVKARRLSFGPAQEHADAFRTALESLARDVSARERCNVEPQVEAAVSAVLLLQALHAPHIAEADDAAMTRMEARMASLEQAARDALQELSNAVPGKTQVAEAKSAFDRFELVHREILALSRKNTNVVSLAMSLGQKRALTTSCDESLARIERELGQRGAVATR